MLADLRWVFLGTGGIFVNASGTRGTGGCTCLGTGKPEALEGLPGEGSLNVRSVIEEELFRLSI